MTEKHAPASRAMLMTMRIRRYGAEHITHYGRSRATLDATGRQDWGQLFAPYCPGGHHGHQIWCKKSSCGFLKLLSEASVQKARNEPSTQLTEATCCVDRLNARMKAEELS